MNPDERLGHIVGDADALIVVTQTGLAGRVGGFFDGELVVIDEEQDAAAIAARPGTDPVALTGPDNLIYVIYTSGSTGKPKGVSLTHGNVLRLFASAQERYGFGEQDVWPLFHSYAFDVSVWEMWGALLHGGRLVVVPAGGDAFAGGVPGCAGGVRGDGAVPDAVGVPFAVGPGG
ncbi:hypothetical protein GCM10020000_13130 [Streptomyces olivoverticillatus]